MPSLRLLTVLFARAPRVATACQWCFLIRSTQAPCRPGISGSPGLTAAQVALCVTPMPALDVGELRTILLIGEYGSAENQPVKVDIVGNLLSIDRLSTSVIAARR